MPLVNSSKKELAMKKAYMFTFVLIMTAVMASPTYAMGRRAADDDTAAQEQRDLNAPSTVSERADQDLSVGGDVPGSAATEDRPGIEDSSIETGTQVDADMRPASDSSGSETNRY
jgi:hypothetical protein